MGNRSTARRSALRVRPAIGESPGPARCMRPLNAQPHRTSVAYLSHGCRMALMPDMRSVRLKQDKAQRCGDVERGATLSLGLCKTSCARIAVADDPRESRREPQVDRQTYTRSFFKKTLGRYLVSPVIGSTHPYALSSSPNTRYPCLVYHSSFVLSTCPRN